MTPMDAELSRKEVYPPGVIFWNEEVSGRTGAKSLERNESMDSKI
jgi:hypothetical protein